MLSGEEAQAFFEHLGTIDPALFSGLFAGFAQIDRPRSSTNNSMLFLQPAVSKRQFISGLSAAVDDEPRASYSPPKNNDAPTTARAGVAFPENDWVTFPAGDQYLANVGESARLRSELAALRERHLDAVDLLLEAIADGRVEDTSPRSSHARDQPRASAGQFSLEAEKAGRIGLGHQVDFCLSEPFFQEDCNRHLVSLGVVHPARLAEISIRMMFAGPSARMSAIFCGP